MSKVSRQHLIAALLSERDVASQVELLRLLAARGVEVSAATLSRDLDDLGALRVRVAGGAVTYAIPEHPVARVAPEPHLRRVLGEWMADVGSSGNLVLMRTPPGCAHVVAAALDRANLREVLGTVAGDDSLIVVAVDGTTGASLASKLRALAGRGSEAPLAAESSGSQAMAPRADEEQRSGPPPGVGYAVDGSLKSVVSSPQAPTSCGGHKTPRSTAAQEDER